MSTPSNYECFKSRQNIELEILKFTLELYEETLLPRAAVDVVINRVDSLISSIIIPHLQIQMENKLKSKEEKNVFFKVNHILESNKNFFSLFDSEHKRFNYYEQNCSYIPPQLYELGEISEFKVVDPNCPSKVVPKKVYGAYIPMPETLKAVFSKTNLFEKMFQYALDLSSQSKVSKCNFIQFEIGKKKYNFKADMLTSGELRFPLDGFSDAFESRGALSSHTGQQKIVGVYYSLPCLPPHLVSKSNNVFLSSLFHSKYLKEENIDYQSVFKMFIEDCIFLSKVGIEILFQGSVRRVFFDCDLT